MNKHLTTPNPTAHLYSGGESTHERRISLALAAVNDISDYADRGDVVMAAQARATLDDLCDWWNDGKSYPPVVREALRERNLRTNR
jgi:hypothetical protein